MTAVNTIDARVLREDFPLLRGAENSLVYLDSAATSQKPEAVLDVLERYYRTQNANVHRGVYGLAEEATAAYEDARADLAAFIGAAPEETIFVRNATEAINLVANTWGRQNLGAGDLVVLTALEHHSNIVPWQLIARETGADLAFVELDQTGQLDLDSLDRHLATGRVRLVSFAYVSNVLGTIAPVGEIARRAHDVGAAVLVDGAQAVPHLPVDVRNLDIDFLAFTGHKMLGPMGIGVLYGRRAILEAMPPFLGGGEMIRRVRREGATWNDLPWKFEAGTPSVGDAVALREAVRYLKNVGLDAIREHDQTVTRYALERLRSMPGVRVFGPDERGAVVAFEVEGVHPHDVATLLDEDHIAVRAGHHCAQPLHDLLGVPATTRASFYLYNDETDVDRLVEGLERVRKVLA